MKRRLMTLPQVNALGGEEFAARFGSLFEGSPWIAMEGWDARPFESFRQLHEKLCAVMYGASIEQKLALIGAHPDLVGQGSRSEAAGRAALAGTLTPESGREQASAGLDRLTIDEIATFTRLNRAYRDRFGFPFVICARENKKDSILAGFEARLRNTRDEELDTALGEIAKIAYLRLADIVEKGQ